MEINIEEIKTREECLEIVQEKLNAGDWESLEVGTAYMHWATMITKKEKRTGKKFGVNEFGRVHEIK